MRLPNADSLPLLRTGKLGLLLGIIAIGLYPWVPVLAWLVPFCFAGAVLVVALRECNPATRLRLLMLCGAAAVIQVIVCVTCGYRQPGPNSMWFDDRGFFAQGAAIAESWRMGVYPELHRKGSPPYVGTLHTGYPRVLGFMFTLFGTDGIAGLAVNVICTALMPLIVFTVYQLLFESKGESMSKAGIIAALLAACHPNVYYWGKLLMKDLLLATLFLLCMALILHSYRRRVLWSAVGAAAMVLLLVTMRAYTAGAILSVPEGWR